MKKAEIQVEELIKILTECGLTELKYEEEEKNLKIKLKKAPEMKVKAPEPKKVVKKEEVKLDTYKFVTSSGIGTYYFDFNSIKVGTKIKVGQELGVIEVMGIRTPVKSNVSGEIVEILVESGGVVDYGKELIKVKSTEI